MAERKLNDTSGSPGAGANREIVRDARSATWQTFQPGRGDPIELKAFLRNVWDEYNNVRRPQLLAAQLATALDSSQDEAKTPASDVLNAFDSSAAARRSAFVSASGLSTTTGAENNKKSPKRKSSQKRSGKTGKGTPKRNMGEAFGGTRTGRSPSAAAASTATVLSKRKRAPEDFSSAAVARANVLRSAKSIDIHAPDPELEAPPGEAPEERRRRMERINGRRKRAKKLIEMEHLNEQRENLKQQNQHLRTENEEIREKIRSIRCIQREGGDISAEIHAIESRLVHQSTDEMKQEQKKPSSCGLTVSQPPSSNLFMLQQGQFPRQEQMVQQGSALANRAPWQAVLPFFSNSPNNSGIALSWAANPLAATFLRRTEQQSSPPPFFASVDTTRRSILDDYSVLSAMLRQQQQQQGNKNQKDRPSG
jgi:hypothetical protein